MEKIEGGILLDRGGICWTEEVNCWNMEDWNCFVAIRGLAYDHTKTFFWEMMFCLK
jgi:hypothetical protein